MAISKDSITNFAGDVASVAQAAQAVACKYYREGGKSGVTAVEFDGRLSGIRSAGALAPEGGGYDFEESATLRVTAAALGFDPREADVVEHVGSGVRLRIDWVRRPVSPGDVEFVCGLKKEG